MSKLNDLSGKEWILLTKSWFQLRGKSRTKELVLHPAKFPENLAERFISFFTKSGEKVLDPFFGVGSAGVAAEALDRVPYGIEINSDFCKTAKTRLSNKNNIVKGDSRDIESYKEKDIDFIITSPPYWNMLKKIRGNSDSQHKDRQKKNLKLFYSNNKNDLGNIDDYDEFLLELKKVFSNCYKVLKKDKYMVVIVQNFRNDDGNYITLAWDIVKTIEKCKFKFEGEQIWCQDDKKLGIWGYPSKFISNVHHHYCLIFRKYEKKK